MMQIVFTRRGQAESKDLGDEFLIGRSEASAIVDLDLSPEMAVSRRHARIWLQDGQHWIEDLNSRNGTFVNDAPIKDRGRYPLRAGDTIRIGGNTFRVLAPGATIRSTPGTAPDSPPTVNLPLDKALESTSLPADQNTLAGSQPGSANAVTKTPSDVDEDNIAKALDAGESVLLSSETSAEESARLLHLLYRISLDFAAEKSLASFARGVVDHLMTVFRAKASRCSFLVYDAVHNKLLLKAGTSPGGPGLSETLARRAMSEAKGFVWLRFDDERARLRNEDASESGPIVCSVDPTMKYGMYAPLLWQGRPLGVLCVDDPARQRPSFSNVFSNDDLRLLLAIAHFAAMALASLQLQESLDAEAKIKANLLCQFSPKIRDRLLAHRGRNRLGGTRGEVTILCSDLRGFTRIANDMEPEDVVDFLNDVFSCLIPVLFAHDGTVDKYVGDAVLAVFGSPDPDAAQYHKAVRAAWQMQASARALNAERAQRSQVTCGMGIAVHCGEVVHGFIGSAERMEFTVIGDPVNYASRYCDAAGDGEIIISPEVYQHVWKIVKAAEITIATKHEGNLRAYRIQEVHG